MSKIKVMSPELANMIAAGEVIERPSSVIKELVENALDASATSVEVRIFNAGKDMISVKDNGDGMDREDAVLAFRRHASSKIRSAYDLMRITTLGFRGEALPSIASVSHVTMITSDGITGTELSMEPGQESVIKDAPLRRGTYFEIRELFYNTPARLKYLKTDRTENYASIETVQHLAMGFPEVSFLLEIDGRVSLKTPGRGNLLETIAAVYGSAIARQCLPFRLEGDGFEADGFIAHPSVSYSSRYDMLTYLNKRSVYIPKVQRALLDGYKDYLPPSRYPLTVLPIRLDYSLVDVNVHPTKREVRLSNEEKLAAAVLDKTRLVLKATRGSFAQPRIAEAEVSVMSNNPISRPDAGESGLTQKGNAVQGEKGIGSLFPSSGKEPESDSRPFVLNDSHGFIEEDMNDSPSSHQSFPALYPIGQILHTYIVCDSEDGMYVIDQHAAAERINFEKCEKEFRQRKDKVIPLFPVVVDLTPAMKSNMNSEHAEKLAELGIVLVPFGPSSVKAEEIPSFLAEKDDAGDLEDIIKQVLSGSKVDLAALEHLAIATKACKMSIKANNTLTHQEQVALIDALAGCANPLNCPHGRPTVIKISRYEIEKLFKRTGF